MKTNLSKKDIFPYISEIVGNAKLSIMLLKEAECFSNSDFKKVQYYSLAITTASIILQIIDNNFAKTNRAKERIKLIKKHYPNIPEPPKNLRSIRNHIQHFDERIDDWFFKSLDKYCSYGIIQDQNKNIEMFSNFKDEFRQYGRRLIGDNEFLYWKHKINILELKKWCFDIIHHFSQ